ncbi:MAG: NAD(P)-dependent oxidoreductase [candidate division FCPU426 bacterium]
MKILVIGADGQVGHFLLRVLGRGHEISGTSLQGLKGLPALDIRDPGAVDRYLESRRPEYVILTAALTHVDKCEDIPDEAERINVRGAEHVAQACRRLDAGLAFFSSEYVFNGRSGPYRETDPTQPESVYGRTKLAGEQVVAALVPNHLIVRTTVVYSYLPGSVNFFMQVLQRAQNREPITVPSDQIGNPTQAVNLAQALGELIEDGRTGVYNLVGTSRVGRDAFARRILEKLGFDPGQVTAVPTASLKQKALRPLAAGLVTDKAQSVLKRHPLWDVERALDFTLAQMRDPELLP